MSEVWAALEATALAQHMKAARWTYPLVNAGHVAGIGLLLGAVVPMDLRLLGVRRVVSAEAAVRLLRPFAAAGLALAVVCGALLFATQATDYVVNGWFQAKMALIATAVANAALHPRLATARPSRQRLAAVLSLALWPAALVCGRMIGFS